MQSSNQVSLYRYQLIIKAGLSRHYAVSWLVNYIIHSMAIINQFGTIESTIHFKFSNHEYLLRRLCLQGNGWCICKLIMKILCCKNKKTGWPYPRHSLGERQELPFSKFTNWKDLTSMISIVAYLLHREKNECEKNHDLIGTWNVTST
jgi:hypothetical protein